MNYTKCMEKMEMDYREESGCKDRSEYAMYYTRIWPAPILVLGLNPGGCPSDYYPDGVRLKNHPKKLGAASASYYENCEHCMLDCSWPENKIVDLLTNVLGERGKIRKKVVKTNLAFRRSRGEGSFKKTHGMSLNDGYKEAAPFVRKIVKIVQPKLIILEGKILKDFKCTMNVVDSKHIDGPIKTIHQTRKMENGETRETKMELYYAECATIPDISRKVVVVRLAHPSRYATRYLKEKIDIRINEFVNL